VVHDAFKLIFFPKIFFSLIVVFAHFGQYTKGSLENPIFSQVGALIVDNLSEFGADGKEYEVVEIFPMEILKFFSLNFKI